MSMLYEQRRKLPMLSKHNIYAYISGQQLFSLSLSLSAYLMVLTYPLNFLIIKCKLKWHTPP